MIGHEASFSAPREFRGDVNPEFKAESKYAGWIQGKHGKPSPVTRHAIGRVAEGYTLDRHGNYAVQVGEYFALKPHDKQLPLVPGEKTEGLSGEEFLVSFAMPMEVANKVVFSHSKIETAQVIPMGRISAKVA